GATEGGCAIETHQTKPIAVLHARRSLTFDDGHRGLRREVVSKLDAGTMGFVIDLADVMEIDSFGVAELVSCHMAVVRKGGRLIFCAPSPKVRQVLAVTRLEGVMESRESEEVALAELQRTVNAIPS
ncbi:MAG TPA: STAS domain-containing protein, partial [Caldimonas sp.]|nr:STAS domain-containing protein [Caldimonas sp.]